MSDGQPVASVQYADWKRWPKTYREPTSEEWLAEVTAANARAEALQEAEQALSLVPIDWQNRADEADRILDLALRSAHSQQFLLTVDRIKSARAMLAPLILTSLSDQEKNEG